MPLACLSWVLQLPSHLADVPNPLIWPRRSLTSYLCPTHLLNFRHNHSPPCPDVKLPSTSGPLHLLLLFPHFFVTDSFRPQHSKATSSVKLLLSTTLKDTSLFHFLQDTHSKTFLFCSFVYLFTVSPLDHNALKGSHLHLVHSCSLRAMNEHLACTRCSEVLDK